MLPVSSPNRSPTEIFTLSLHDALPISDPGGGGHRRLSELRIPAGTAGRRSSERRRERKSRRLNSSHGRISYGRFCLSKSRRERGTGHSQVSDGQVSVETDADRNDYGST